MLNQPVYNNVQAFLDLLEQLILYPHEVTHRSFQKKVEDTLQFIALEREDLQASSFYAWLKAKMMHRPYYEVLLELAGAK